MKRTYQLKRRAKAQARTRHKIIEAAMALHQAKGLSATSMRDVAQKADVGVVTVYRHFPDDMALLGACSGAYFERHPFPDPESWRSIRDAHQRWREGLRETYAFHRETEPMIARVMDEVRDLPLMEPYFAHWRHAADVLLEAWPEAVRNDRKMRAATALALRFETWWALAVQEGLSDDEAVELMSRIVCDCRAMPRRPGGDRG